MKIGYSFTGKIKVYPSDGGATWYFVSIPKEHYTELREISTNFKKGFGSIKVDASTEISRWQTSIFPDTKSGNYILFIKKQIRKENAVGVGGSLKVSIELKLPPL